MTRPERFDDLLADLPHVAASEVRLCARTLLRHPIMREGGPKADLLPLLHRHRNVLRVLFVSYLGYPLTVERRVARLYKAPDAVDGRGIANFTARTYAYLALTLAVLVGIGRQILLSQLIAEVRGAAAEAGVRVSDRPAELRDFAAALQYLVQQGVLEETEGTVQSVQHRYSGEALITVDLELLGYFIPKPHDETDEALADRDMLQSSVGMHARRRLLENPVVLYSELPPDERQYLREHTRQEAYWAEQYLGLQIEIRAEGMAAVDPDGLLTDVPFPGTSTLARISILALPHLLNHAVSDESGLQRVQGHHLSEVCTELVERYPNAWAKRDLANMDALAGRVADYLLAVGVARPAGAEELVLVPAAFRWEPAADDRGSVQAPVSEQEPSEPDRYGEERLF